MCQRLVSIPANPAYGSLNLAAAVQVACYELATSAARFAAPAAKAGEPATREDVEGLFAQLESTAVASGFLDAANPGRFMERMRRLFARVRLERQEVKLLRGLLGALEKKKRR
jgi:tRNA/rRNA methyltransferase